MPGAGKKLLSATGAEYINRVGSDEAKRVVLAVLCGRNLRDSTELLTRRKLALLNAATLAMFIQGACEDPDFATSAPLIAAEELQERIAKEDRWVLQWLLGLNGKAFQNVLRDRHAGLEDYARSYLSANAEVSQASEKEYGQLTGALSLGGMRIAFDWPLALQLLGTVGAQTLAIRGSDKSLYGKLFERLILGSVLTILGFRHVSPDAPGELKGVFWLSSKGKRESDATALCRPGQGIRFDIGFIGRGNPEISLDKVTRFERHLEIEKVKFYIATIVIVDTIGRKSGIEELAKRIDGHIIQMSANYWPKRLAEVLRSKLGYDSKLCHVPDGEMEGYLRHALDRIDISGFLRGVTVAATEEEEE